MQDDPVRLTPDGGDRGSPLDRRERVRILTERVDALLAEARQMDIPVERVVELIRRREARLESDGKEYSRD